MGVRVSRPFEPKPSRRGLGSDPDVRDPALAYVEPPPSLRIVANVVTGLFLVLAVTLLIVPWQQSAIGVGRVIAYAPADRQQRVEAPVDGRLDQWLVSEGSVVKAGDPLIQIMDNDPAFVERLERQLTATLAEQTAVAQQIRSYESKIVASQAGLELAVAEYESKIAELKQKRVSDAAALEAARRNQLRISTLADEGIASQREREVTQMKFDSATAKVDARDSEIAAARQARGKARAEAETKVASAEAELEVAKTKLAEVERKLLDLEVKQSRQSAQLVRAPRDGTVLRLYGGPGGGQIKQGDPLLTLVPNTQSRAAELWVDGNDMPFVEKGAHVRLVFEGWPALQVVGLPGASQGTFGGVVAFVDATDDGKGKFRVVVVQDPEGSPWPEHGVLRQGVRTKGWVMLGRVTLGYELWRQLNGFPALPTVEKGEKVNLPSAKKPRAPAELK